MKKILTILSFLALCLACSKPQTSGKPDGGDVPEPPAEATAQTPGFSIFYKGGTMSFASYFEDAGLVYRENGEPADPYASMKAHGANCVRLQLDRAAFAKKDGQTIDWQTMDRVIEDAKRALAQGLEIFLTMKPDYDIYGSGATSHNNLPGQWANLNETALGQALYDWVYDSLAKLAGEGIFPAIVAVGNEVSVGFLKPAADAPVDNGRTGRLLKYAHQAVRDYAEDWNPACLSAVHVENPSRAEWSIRQIEAAGAKDYDIVAISYYPGSAIGHSLPDGKSVKDLAGAFGDKKMMIVETAYSFTTGSVDGKWMGDNCNNAYNYPDWGADSENLVNYTPAKGREWLGNLAKQIRDGGGAGLITWGTESLPADGVYTYPADWACGSTWENNSYWDFTDSNNMHEGADWMKDIE